MSTPSPPRPCPHCGAPLGAHARFCAQCGQTVATVEEPLSREDATVARAMPALEAFERELAAATGQTALAPPDPARAAGRPGAAEANLEHTLAERDPYGSMPEEATQKLGKLGKTMLFGGATPAPALGGPAELPSTAPMHPALASAQVRAPATAPGSPTPAEARRPDASPLSRSVLAPQSWMPPAGAGSMQPAPVVGVAPGPPAPPPAAPLPAGAAARTMLGMPASALERPGASQGAPAPHGAPAQAGPAFPSAARTMLGVAIPGIAPTHGAGGPPAAAPAGPSAAPALPSKQGTLLGVAAPGVAPLRPGSAAQGPAGAPAFAGQPTAYGLGAAASPPAIVPAPAPLQEEPLPVGPTLPAKRGVPAVAVVGLVMGLLAMGGVAIALAMRGSAPIVAQPQLDETGRESLKLTCESCPDGTTVTLGASKATMQGHAALLPLPAPLSIGENTLQVAIDRPAAGRDEEVKIHVPVAYRVRADLTTVSVTPPAITIRVEALQGTDVRVEDNPVALDATGKGSYAIAIAKEAEGPSDDAKTIERKIPFRITKEDGKPESGELLARVVVVPVHIDAPGTLLYTDRTNAPISGQTKAGGTVTVDGAPVPVDAQGRFGVRAELPPAGEKEIAIVASAPSLASRTVRSRVVRVASLEAAARELEAKSPLSYATYAKDPARTTGEDGVVEGEIVRASIGGGHSVLVVEDKSCSAGSAPCVVRVLHGEEARVAVGDSVRAYGRLGGAVTLGGQTAIELDASLVLPLPRGTKK